jgi:hypothetical protein
MKVLDIGCFCYAVGINLPSYFYFNSNDATRIYSPSSFTSKMFGQSFVFANPQIHTWTNVDMLRKDGRYVCGIRHWARDHTWKPNVFRMFLSRLCEVGSANAHAKFRQEFSRTEYPGDDKLRVPKDDFSTEYDFERKGNHSTLVGSPRCLKFVPLNFLKFGYLL